MVDLQHHMPNNHVLIIALQREMDALKQKITQEIKNLRKKNVILK